MSFTFKTKNPRISDHFCFFFLIYFLLDVLFFSCFCFEFHFGVVVVDARLHVFFFLLAQNLHMNLQREMEYVFIHIAVLFC